MFFMSPVNEHVTFCACLICEKRQCSFIIIETGLLGCSGIVVFPRGEEIKTQTRVIGEKTGD